ncbi:2-methylcitrate dehydratase [Bordetella tumbae]|uniref:MmgE/PrpD family protein n=1 Tax=Bordetella tumbae TaxID=1649139 RepID=UPI0039F11E35
MALPSVSTLPLPEKLNTHARGLLEYLHGLAELTDPHPLERARGCLMDALGCGLFGATQPWGKIITEEALSESSQGHCRILGSTAMVAAGQAALCNGTAMHGFELDDLLSAALIHPGAVIVPAAIAAAEAVDASGLQLLRGIVAGYEAMERISLALGTEPSHRGFHKTSVVGPVAASIAASVVMRLDFQQLQWAVGLACSCASGVKNFAAGGAGMVKRLHAGRAAEAGVRTALLARRGFTAPVGAIDGKFGLLEAFGGATARPELLDDALGSRWAVDDVWVKVYPICGWIQGVVQLILEMREQESLDTASVAEVVVSTSTFAVKNNGNVEPEDTMDAQYSIPYCVAVALTGEPMDPSEYGVARIQDSRRKAIAQRVTLKADPAADEVYPKHFFSAVSLHLNDGRVLSARTMDPHGTPDHPCSPKERAQKFTRLVELAELDIDGSKSLACVEGIAAISARELMDSMTPSL